MSYAPRRNWHNREPLQVDVPAGYVTDQVTQDFLVGLLKIIDARNRLEILAIEYLDEHELFSFIDGSKKEFTSYNGADHLEAIRELILHALDWEELP